VVVSYQEGAVVSRIILKRETGNVTLFAFDAGQELSEHTTPYDALVHIVDATLRSPSPSGRIDCTLVT